MTVAPVEAPATSRYVSVQIHPDTLPLVLGVLANYGVNVERITDGPTRQHRFVTGKPTKVPNLTGNTPMNAAAVEARLTSREFEVLTGMSEGKSNATIGRELSLSEDTIKTHARRMFRKLGVSDRTSAVVHAFRNGIVPLERKS